MASSVETMIRNVVGKGVMKVAGFNRSRMKGEGDNPFLTGIHTPMEEELTLIDLPTSGTIPPELDGRYIRIGPNPINAVPASHHWFAGDGMVHGIALKGGKAQWYRNRWIRSKQVSAALGEPEAPGPRGSTFDTVNTNVLGHGGQTWAIVEAGGFPVRIDQELNTIAHDPFGGSLKNAFSAHPHLDPDTGEMHAICYKGDVQDRVWHVVVDKNGKVRREEPIPVKSGPMIHDCMITKNYVIIMDLPVTFSMKRLLAGYSFPYAWNPDHPARVGLLPREGKASEIIWCAVDPCLVFHPCNAFEEADGTVTLDVCAHATMFTESTQGPDSQSSAFERWTIDPKSKKVARAVIDTDAQEFPRPNEALIGKPYRYAYTVRFPEGAADAFTSRSDLVKHDLIAATRQVHDFGPARIAGEFVFVAKENAKAEDDGWLMGYVIDTDSETTDFVILDAANFEGAAQAVVTLPHRIPPGFHGNWVAA